MGLADSINKLTLIIIIVSVAILAVITVGSMLLYFLFIRKRRMRMENTFVDYSGLKRTDTKDYLKFDDIKDRMIITDNGRRFIAVIRCRGYEYYSAYVGERLNTQAGYRGFVNTITSPITYRQYAKTIDLDYTKEKYKAAYKNLEEQLFDMTESYREMKKSLNEMKKALGDDIVDSPEAQLLISNMEEKQKQIKNMEWRRFHIKDQMAYHDQISGNDVAPAQNETYVLDWVYNPMDYPVDLTPKEIYKKAVKELNIKCQTYIHALSSAGVKGIRCTTGELVDMYRRHMNPLSSSRYKLDVGNFEDSEYFKEIMTTSLKDELDEEYRDTMEYSMTKSLEEALTNVQGNILNEVIMQHTNREDRETEDTKEGSLDVWKKKE